MNITIPPEALEAAARAIGAETYVGNKQTLRDAARAAIAAALNAWPGSHTLETGVYYRNTSPDDRLILPLPTEARDE